MLLCIAALAGCTEIDRLLEATPPIDTFLSVAAESAHVSIAQGGEHSMRVTVTRPSGVTGDVSLLVPQPPTGVTATFSNLTNEGPTTSATFTLRVAPSTPLGTYAVGIRGRGHRVNDGIASIQLQVVEPPSFGLTLSKSSLTIAKGGIAPLVARVARTNYSSAIAFTLAGPPGITATFTPDPASGDSTRVTVSVAANVAPATYDVTIRGVGNGAAEQSASLAVVVTNDPLQIIAPAEINGPQGTERRGDVIINRAGFDGNVELSTDNVPPGATVSFDPNSGMSTSSTMTVDIGPTTAPGSYTIVVRGRGTGLPDAVAEVDLTVTPTTVSLAIEPQSVTVFAGANVATMLTIGRVGAADSVDIGVEDTPPGMAVVPSTTRTAGASVQLTLSAGSGMPAGQHAIVIRGAPAGFPTSASKTVTLNVTVRAVPPGVGNVVLDWSRCSVPQWVAFKDNFGSWTQGTPNAGAVRFSITGGRGGFAYTDGNAVHVRFMTQAELETRPFDMCPPSPATKIVTGSGVHTSAAVETYFHFLGGASATSTPNQPDFSLIGVEDGVHDFIAWGITPTGRRGQIRRDLNPADGESLGMIDLNAQSFPFRSATFSVTGGLSGETLAHTLSYLTTARCTVNQLTTAPAFFGGGQPMFGIPASAQRPTDFHMLTLSTSTVTTARSIALVFHDMINRAIAMPVLPAAPFVGTLSGSYKQLVASFSIPVAYNRAVTLTYSTGVKTMSVGATRAYVGTGVQFTTLFMPEFGAVSGWPATAPIASDQTGNWSLVFEGETLPGSLCTEGRAAISATRRGAF